jgi:hypothetical protein
MDLRRAGLRSAMLITTLITCACRSCRDVSVEMDRISLGPVSDSDKGSTPASPFSIPFVSPASNSVQVRLHGY